MKLTFVVVLLLLLFSSFTLAYQHIQFNVWKDKGHEKLKGISKSEISVSPETLPPLLQNYLKRVLVRMPSGSFVKFTQTGEFRMNPEDKMSNFSAEQFASVVSPMFSWVATVRMSGLPITVCDRLVDGQGELQARLFSSVPLAKGAGDSFLRGELLRYLAELPWYPMAILNQPDIVWKQVDENKVTGTLSMKSISATVEYIFNEEGLIHTIFVPDREKSDGKTVKLKPWLGEFTKYEEREGVLMPIQGKVSWLLDSGKFTYFVGNITSYQLKGN